MALGQDDGCWFLPAELFLVPPEWLQKEESGKDGVLLGDNSAGTAGSARSRNLSTGWILFPHCRWE